MLESKVRKVDFAWRCLGSCLLLLPCLVKSHINLLCGHGSDINRIDNKKADYVMVMKVRTSRTCICICILSPISIGQKQTDIHAHTHTQAHASTYAGAQGGHGGRTPFTQLTSLLLKQLLEDKADAEVLEKKMDAEEADRRIKDIQAVVDNWLAQQPPGRISSLARTQSTASGLLTVERISELAAVNAHHELIGKSVCCAWFAPFSLLLHLERVSDT